jgi:hypothetical protein
LVRTQRLVLRAIVIVVAVIVGFWILMELIKLVSGVPL